MTLKSDSTTSVIEVNDVNGVLEGLTVKNCIIDGASSGAHKAIFPTEGKITGDIKIEGTTFKNFVGSILIDTVKTGLENTGFLKTVVFKSNILTTNIRGHIAFRGKVGKLITTVNVEKNSITYTA